MTTPKISLTAVRKQFGAKVVLDGVDLEVAAGESVVIIGGSGTGKSVTLKCILGLLRPDSGAIRIDGEDIVKYSGGRRDRLLRRFGMLFQGAALFDSLPVWQNVVFGLLARGAIARGKARDTAAEKLAMVGMGSEILDMHPASLSAGMRKRVGLARAIATDPEIIFFDEPTTGLDPIVGDVINDLIVKCVREMGATALTITHDMASARKIADRIAMLYRGKIMWSGPVSEIDDTDNPYVDQFIHGRPDGPIGIEVRPD